jgi:hypothetical protein
MKSHSSKVKAEKILWNVLLFIQVQRYKKGFIAGSDNEKQIKSEFRKLNILFEIITLECLPLSL